MAANSKVTLAVLNQKIDDILIRVERFDSKLKAIMDKTDSNSMKLVEIDTIQRTCPAKLDKEKGITRDWVKWSPAIIALIISIISIITR